MRSSRPVTTDPRTMPDMVASKPDRLTKLASCTISFIKNTQKFYVSRAHVRKTHAQKQTGNKPSEQQIKTEEVRVGRDQGDGYR